MLSDTDAREDDGPGIERRLLLQGLDRLAFYFETSDPHLRHEAHVVAKQNLSRVAREGQYD